MIRNINYSILVSVYFRECPENLNLSLNSIIEQTIPPTEIVLVKDGPLTSRLETVIAQFVDKYPNLFKLIPMEENKGLSVALNVGLERCTYAYVARMDTDDISLPDRFAKQLKCFIKDPDLSVVGGNIAEFIEFADNIIGIRTCPLTDSKIKSYMKLRCPLNHMSVMMKKEDVLKAGSYQNWFWNEDYFLWIRMMQAGCKFQNLDDVLVKVRVGKEMYARRGGFKYFKSEAALQKYMLNNHIVSFPRYVINLMIRFVVQILMSDKLRGFVFRKFFRNKYNNFQK